MLWSQHLLRTSRSRSWWIGDRRTCCISDELLCRCRALESKRVIVIFPKHEAPEPPDFPLSCDYFDDGQTLTQRDDVRRIDCQ